MPAEMRVGFTASQVCAKLQPTDHFDVIESTSPIAL